MHSFQVRKQRMELHLTFWNPLLEHAFSITATPPILLTNNVDKATYDR